MDKGNEIGMVIFPIVFVIIFAVGAFGYSSSFEQKGSQVIVDHYPQILNLQMLDFFWVLATVSLFVSCVVALLGEGFIALLRMLGSKRIKS